MAMPAASRDDFAEELRSAIRGEVLSDGLSRGIYSTDASHYQVMPSCVVVPRDEADVIAAMRIASDRRIPITPRGGGTSLSGQTTWTGLVLDLSKYCNRLLEVNVEEGWARVQPGLVRDELNAQLAEHRLHFAPDPATGNRANVGGMIGNNSSGTRSIVYGKTIDHVLETKVVLADGTVAWLRPHSLAEWDRIAAEPDRLGSLHAGVGRVVRANAEEIRRRYPKVMRRVSGYNLDAFVGPSDSEWPATWNLSHLIVGSEGTLATLLEAKVRLTPVPKATALCIVHFADLIDSLRAVVPILEHGPSAVEVLDRFVLDESRTNRATAAMADFLVGAPTAVLVVEFFGETRDEASARARELASQLAGRQIGYAWPVRTTPAEIQRVWEVRKLGLGLISNVKGKRKALDFIDDACVPVEHLPEYIERVLALCDRHGVPVSAYAHASVGVLHVKPLLDLHDPNDVVLMRKIADEAFELVVSYGGSWSSEHGDGLVRGEFIPRFYGPRIYQAFREVKKLFDPHDVMNPGKILDAEPMTSHLRYYPGYQPPKVDSAFHYREEEGFAQAVEKCNGVGACRKTNSGTMCPSYMATRDEEHSTRGRANALRLAMTGQLGAKALASDRLHEALSLCLACKACKTECPNSVDMSRMKADVLRWRYQEKGTPLNARFVADMPKNLRRMAGPLAGWINWLQRQNWFRASLEQWVGVDRRRPLPAVAHESLARWFARRSPSIQPHSTLGTVLLFCDSFTNALEPHVGIAAVRLLESCGYRVELADVGCCQRPAISKGMLDAARVGGSKTLKDLERRLRDTQAQAILVLEPSCASALGEDLPDLMAVPPSSDFLGRIQMIDLFLHQEHRLGRLPVRFTSPFQKLLIHGHCHQKALYGTASMKALLETVEGLQFTEVDSGCCGMAGSFGYEHLDLSRTIGEQRLFPAVRERAAGTEVVACGISCRHQLNDFLGVHARHWVEALSAHRLSPSG